MTLHLYYRRVNKFFKKKKDQNKTQNLTVVVTYVKD